MLVTHTKFLWIVARYHKQIDWFVVDADRFASDQFLDPQKLGLIFRALKIPQKLKNSLKFDKRLKNSSKIEKGY
jgi:hypothetical protein